MQTKLSKLIFIGYFSLLYFITKVLIDNLNIGKGMSNIKLSYILLFYAKTVTASNA